MNALAIPPSADLPAMQAWARKIMNSRAPDYVIGTGYLNRWYIVPRNPWSNLYLHAFLGSDDDRALHDHPWANTSLLIEGSYIEHTPDGGFERRAGDLVSRTAETKHRLELISELPVISLFATGPKVREWGFACPHGWVHWADFTDPDNPARTGGGCGEPGDLARVTVPGMVPA